MKKTYVNPEMDIWGFDAEVLTDILSASVQTTDNLRFDWDGNAQV